MDYYNRIIESRNKTFNTPTEKGYNYEKIICVF